MIAGGADVASGAALDAIVLAALPEEMGPLRAMLGNVRLLDGEKAIWRGRWAGREVALVVTGDGERNARTQAAAAFRRLRPRLVIAIGVAGAVSPQLALGDTLVAHQVMREQGDAWPASAPLLAAAARLTQARPGALISIPRLATTVADKRRLAAVAAARAPGLAAAVDLESAAFVAAAAARGLPWLILRAISDVASEELPALLNECLDDGGAVRRARLAVGLFGQPAALLQLLLLRQRVRSCAEALAAAATSVLAGAFERELVAAGAHPDGGPSP